MSNPTRSEWGQGTVRGDLSDYGFVASRIGRALGALGEMGDSRLVRKAQFYLGEALDVVYALEEDANGGEVPEGRPS